MNDDDITGDLVSRELDDDIKHELIKDLSKEILTEKIKTADKVLNDSADDLKIIAQFKVGRRYWFQNATLKNKEICFSFKPTFDEENTWKEKGLPRIGSLLTHLKKLYGGLDKFELIFFKVLKPKTHYFEPFGSKTNVYVNLLRYSEYSQVLNPILNNLKVTKYSRKISREYAKKVPKAFFANKSPKHLVEELRHSDYKALELIISEYENLPEEEKKDWKTLVEHSKLGEETYQEFTKLSPDSPPKQLKLFLKVIPKLGGKEFEILLKTLLKSKSTRQFVQTIGTLSAKEQAKLAKNLTSMSQMYDRYEKLEESLKQFKILIKKHLDSDKKDEKEIHRFLTVHYWLLGIEYFGRQVNSDITSDGKRTNDTKIGRKHADFIILQRLDGLDKCVVIELEEANDKIFNTDGTFSKEVYDGIVQAIDYSLEQKLAKVYSKGIAVIGSLSVRALSTLGKRRLELLSESFPNVEILTYDQIIEKAQTTLDFWKRYESSSDVIN